MNKEIEELLNYIDQFVYVDQTYNDIRLSKIDCKLLLSYIEQLEKQAELGEHYKHLYSEVKKQKDDVVEYIKNNAEEYKWEDDDGAINKDYCCEGTVILRMLGEIE